MARTPAWLRDAVGYQIFPASFQDSDGDGIGDLAGIRSRLDYLAWLGIDCLWICPCFASAFRDGGYDITDFYRIAERYGTNKQLRKLVRDAHARGIRILLDLVATHTSIDHPWFQASQRHERNADSDRYVWTDDWWHERHPELDLTWGLGQRPGLVASNFFYHQPKLNYGFGKPDRSWQMPVDHPAVQRNREELVAIMRHWLAMGVDGFRVDCAATYVPCDPGLRENARLWRWVRAQLGEEFPDMALIAEWPEAWQALKVGFDGAFMLHNQPGYHAMFLPGERATTARGTFFDPRGEGDATTFIDQYAQWQQRSHGHGHICLPTSNHDTRRVSTDRDVDTLEQLFAFILTMPSVPFIYYGEEIGLRHLDGLPSKEGAYPRTGCRTPMQWDSSKKAGFSTARRRDFYLPLDPRPDRPSVAAQADDPDSLLSRVRRLIALRKAHRALRGGGGYTVLHARARRSPLVYRRHHGRESLLVALNPVDAPATVRVEGAGFAHARELLGRGGVTWRPGRRYLHLEMPRRSWAILGQGKA